MLVKSKAPWVWASPPDGKANPEPRAFGKLPMAEKNGVDGIPFLVLVGKDGKVDSLHVRGTRLKTRLTQLLGEPAEAKPVEVPSDPTKPAADSPLEKPADKPATDKPATDKPATDKPATDKPAAKKPAAEKPAENSGAFAPAGAATPLALFVAQAILAADEPAAEKKDPPPAAEDLAAVGHRDRGAGRPTKRDRRELERLRGR